MPGAGTDGEKVQRESVIPDTAKDAGIDASIDAGPDDVGAEVSNGCAVVSTGYLDGFFTVESYGGKLNAGLFDYGHKAESMLYSYASWALTSPGLTVITEFICDMRVFNGECYADSTFEAAVNELFGC